MGATPAIRIFHAVGPARSAVPHRHENRSASRSRAIMPEPTRLRHSRRPGDKLRLWIARAPDRGPGRIAPAVSPARWSSVRARC
jgi:hypothetical protein